MKEKTQKKPIKKYFIAQFCEQRVKILKTEKEYEQLLKTLRNTNTSNLKSGPSTDKSKNLIYGNVKKEINENGEIIATISIYTQLSEKDTIENLDNKTTKMIDMTEFLEKYGHLRRNDRYYPKILSFGSRTYKDDNGINTSYDIGVCEDRLFFSFDNIYLNPNYLKFVIGSAANSENFYFLERLSVSFAKYPYATDDCISLRKSIKNVKEYGFLPSNLLLDAKHIYENVIFKKKNGKFELDEDGEKVIDYKALRNLADFISICEQDGTLVLYNEEPLESEEINYLNK